MKKLMAILIIILFLFITSVYAEEGCCLFDNEENYSCSYMVSKDLCKGEAQKHQVLGFSFDTSLNEVGCEKYCEDFTSTTNLTSLTTSETKETTEEGGFSFFWLFVILIIIAAIYFAVKNSKVKDFLKKFIPSPPQQFKDIDPNAVSPFNSNPLTRFKINLIRKKHQAKVNKYHKKSLLTGSGFPSDKTIQDEIQEAKIKNIVNTRKLEKHLEKHHKNKGYKNLDEMVSKTKK